ncbi:MAG: AsmA family protein [Rhodobacteraceae bacterium]|nr:AsmA family protein [Paracoccaceae bacterium]
MRWVFRIIAIALIALVVAVAALFFLPGERIAKIAADQVKAYTGRDLIIDGGVSVTLWPVLGVKTGAVTFGNADWAGPEPMLVAQNLAIGISAPDLLRGDIRVKRIVADSPKLRLSTREDGQGNWQFEAASDEQSSDANTTTDTTNVPLTLERLTLTDASLVYTAAGAEPVLVKNTDLSLVWPDAGGPADIVLIARPAGDLVTIAANIGGFAGFLDGKVAPISARVTAPGSEIDFLGRANLSGDASGHIVLNSSNTAVMLQAFGLGSFEIPHGLGHMAKLDGEVTFTNDGRLSARDMTLKLDDNHLTGAVDVTFAETPQITARLSAGALEFLRLTETHEGSIKPRSAAAAGTGWSVEAIDASGLGAVNGTIGFAAQSIKTDLAQLGPTQAVLQIDRSRAVLELIKVSAYGGMLTGQLVANNRGGLSVGGHLRATNIGMKAALDDLAGFDSLDGQADVQIKFLGVGGSMDAIMRSLSGQGSLKMDRGVVSGFDLDRLMRSGDSTGGTTVFDSLTATYTIAEGNLVNKDLLLLLPKVQANGAGRIGLGDQDIDYLMIPALLRGDDNPRQSIPVRFRGPWSDVKIRPDLGAAVDNKIENLEQNARDAAQKKLEKELLRLLEKN